MSINLKCPHCGRSTVGVRNEHLALAALGAVVTGPLAVFFGLKMGLLAILVAAFQGNRNASLLLRVKAQLMRASQQVGSLFYCKDTNCNEDIGVEAIFQQLTSSN